METTTRAAEVRPETYALAEALLPGNGGRLIVGGETRTRFLPGSDRFLLTEERGEEERVLLVDPDAGTCEEPPGDERAPLGKEWSISPDGRWAVRAVDANVRLLDRDAGEERQITHDGTPDRPYAVRLDFFTLERRLAGLPLDPLIVWSPDSTRFAMERLDQSAVKSTHLLQVVEDDPRPRLLTYRAALPGDRDDEITTVRLHVVEVASGTVTPVQMDPVPSSSLQPMLNGHVWFSPDGARLEAVVQRRDQRDLRLLSIDPASGVARTAAEQHGPSAIDASLLVFDERPAARVLDDGRAVWLSERDGWAHLWLVDGEDWHQLTHGEWVVRELLHVDEQRGELLFTASGRERDGGPIERRLYRLPLAGGETQLLTPEPLDHAIAVAPSGRWLVDCQSSPQVPPVTVLRDARDGRVVRELAHADVSALEATGWRTPERFTVLAADGETELHGMLYLPPDFDEERRWPLLDVVYPGPQICIVPSRFGITYWQFDAYAALGIVVMALDARGTPLRSKAFHDTSYGRMEATHAIADHAAAVRQLAERHPWIDAERAGITGSSGGGAMTVRALIERPETFKVGISGVGNHDNLRYHAGWGERYTPPVAESPEAWERQSNVAVAARLRGRLLLLHSELDANVNPVCTRALIAALVDADVDHDVILLPNGDHFELSHPYPARRAWDYLVRHLIGAEPPAYRISPDSVRRRDLL